MKVFKVLLARIGLWRAKKKMLEAIDEEKFVSERLLTNEGEPEVQAVSGFFSLTKLRLDDMMSTARQARETAKNISETIAKPGPKPKGA